MKDKLSKIEVAAAEAAANAVTEIELQQVRARYLGKKGEITAVMKGMGQLSPEERPLVGALANEVKGRLEIVFTDRQAGLRQEQNGFAECMDTLATRNKLYLFFATRKTHKVPELQAVTARQVKGAAVVGMGSMGTGIAQALATIPGISRSGATISAGLLMKNGRSEVARFFFLMVLIPIIGAALLDILSMTSSPAEGKIAVSSLLIGFLAAFISGYLACTWMIRLVKKGNLYWFAVYCAMVGIISIIFA